MLALKIFLALMVVTALCQTLMAFGERRRTRQFLAMANRLAGEAKAKGAKLASTEAGSS